MDPDSRQTGTAAIAAPSAVQRNGPSVLTRGVISVKFLASGTIYTGSDANTASCTTGTVYLFQGKGAGASR